MPLYDYECKKCGKKIEYLAASQEKYRLCPGAQSSDFPGLIKKCDGVMNKIPGIFCIHDPWRWAVLTSDGAGVLQDPGDPVDTLYESMDEQEFYEGPEGEHAYPYAGIAPMRHHDGIPWWEREEWENDTDNNAEESCSTPPKEDF
jgi:putative FmdB family regulatory protein